MPYKNIADRKANSRKYYLKNKAAIAAKNAADPDHLRRALEWNAKHAERVKQFKRKVVCKAHGISVEQYEQAEKDQGNLCAICRQPEERNQHLSIDHDHRCCPGPYGCIKCFRGLLCSRCNTALGQFRDDRYILEQAIRYLTRGFNVEI